uniref:Dehydrogenase/reductase SDR family member 7B n=1 Tax=Parascaris univalens TaxID=6257 RepID=A0A914ZNN3_PARUN
MGTLKKKLYWIYFHFHLISLLSRSLLLISSPTSAFFYIPHKERVSLLLSIAFANNYLNHRCFSKWLRKSPIAGVLIKLL